MAKGAVKSNYWLMGLPRAGSSIMGASMRTRERTKGEVDDEILLSFK